jgi:hypothetical protein
VRDLEKEVHWSALLAILQIVDLIQTTPTSRGSNLETRRGLIETGAGDRVDISGEQIKTASIT